MDEHVLSTYARAEEVFVAGQGAEIVDANGRKYLDFLGGIAVSALGHAHPRLVAELADQARKVLHVSNLYRHPYTEDVAARLAHLCGLESVFFANSGAEANECALKLARKHQRDAGHAERTGFVAIEGGFHGRTMGALSLTHNAKYRAPFEPLIPGCSWVPANDVSALEAELRARKPAALVLEPIQGEAGVRELEPAFLRAARRVCDETGTLLVHDEVQAGCGRTGTFLSGDHAGVKPDIVTLAKPLAAGLPMGACVVSKALSSTFQPGDHGSTFAGGPFVCRAALVFLSELEEGGLLAKVQERGTQLRAGLEGLQKELGIVVELRGRGLIQGLRLARDAEKIQRDLYRAGLITNRTGGDVIRLLPPYVIQPAEIARGLEILREVLRAA